MASPKKCKLLVNNTWGYCYTPREYPSIRQAYRAGRDFIGGFWFRIVCDSKVVKTGHCDR